MSNADHVKEHIELAIERARGNVGERIDELDRKLRERLDFAQIAGDHAPQLLAAGAVFGFLLGIGVPRLIVRTLQLGVPIAIAVQIVRKRIEQAREEEAYPPTIS